MPHPNPLTPGHHVLDPTMPLGEAVRVGWLLTVLVEHGPPGPGVRPLLWAYRSAIPGTPYAWGIQTTCN